ncbi:hypothetical protein ACP275_12G162900 [Erythranthe tilingii]
MKAELRPNPSTISLQNPNLFPTSTAAAATTQSDSVSGAALTGCCLGHLDGACIEKLLLHCASALERNDVTLAQQIMWVLNNVASSAGDPNQRLASYFLKALVSKASSLCPTTITTFNSSSSAVGGGARRLMSVTELAGYVDLIPWHRFGFCASNSAILNAIRGFPKVHILDFSITHCMQWPTLIDAVAKRAAEGGGGPPLLSLRISVLSWRPNVPPFLNASIEEVGQRLTNFANYRDVPFQFDVVHHHEVTGQDSNFLLGQLNPSTLKLSNDEALVVNCQNWLRYLPDDDDDEEEEDDIRRNILSYGRDSFLETIRNLNPCLVTIVDEDCDLGGSNRSLASRITACFNYMWIPFDALETFLPKNSARRLDYEEDIGRKIENVVGFEGARRIERLESSSNLWRRMAMNNGFTSVPFGEETVREVRVLLSEHASGWGMKKDEEMMVLTWKGHNSVYATAWAPLDRAIT